VQVDDEKTKKNEGRLDQLQLLAAILAQWQRSVASIEALDLLHHAMSTVMYRRIPMAIKMAIFAGVFVDCCLMPVALAVAGAIWSK
jgi:hypothetical protein